MSPFLSFLFYFFLTSNSLSFSLFLSSLFLFSSYRLCSYYSLTFSPSYINYFSFLKSCNSPSFQFFSFIYQNCRPFYFFLSISLFCLFFHSDSFLLFRILLNFNTPSIFQIYEWFFFHIWIEKSNKIIQIYFKPSFKLISSPSSTDYFCLKCKLFPHLFYCIFCHLFYMGKYYWISIKLSLVKQPFSKLFFCFICKRKIQFEVNEWTQISGKINRK